MELTLAQAKEFLTSLGLWVPPDALLQLIVDQINSIDECLAAAGYPPSTIGLIKYYLLALIGIVQTNRYVTSERAPSGASRSYAFGTLSQGYNQYLNLLHMYDKSGCTDGLIPEDPEGANCALFVGSSNGCCE